MDRPTATQPFLLAVREADTPAPAAQPPTTQTASVRVGSILLVDDDRMGLLSLSSMIEDLGYRVETATDGAEAFAMMREDPDRADIIVTDRMMPVMDGLALTRRLKRTKETAATPVVLLTGASSAEDVNDGLAAGAFYYLSKPADPGMVESVLNSAMREVKRSKGISEQLNSHQAAFRNIEIMRMRLSRPDEVESVCSLLASMHEQPDRIVQGIYELVQNGIEHGLLGFGLENKSRLLAEGQWEAALASQSRKVASQGRSVEATMIRKENTLVLSVKDPGSGFAWRAYLGADQARSSTLCGRGIARANTLVFDRIAYNEAGNEVTAILRLEKQIKW